ncbi:MAG TPA: hypothetical protein VJU77_16685 [Chthoniobacterales bacterium]|nr:hypothetical protein [Chthoniobacterales bacterium]
MSTPDREDPLPVTGTRNSAIIKGGIRTLAQFVPLVGGAFSQAWNEYETYSQSARVDEFFDRLTARVAAMEQGVAELAANVKKLPDAAELLEDIVRRVKREPEDGKRHYYVNVLTSFIAQPESTTRDERQTIIDDLDTLTAQDITYLQKFAAGAQRGDWISSTEDTGFEDVGLGTGKEDMKWDAMLGPAINSVAKLEARGLITQASINAMFSLTGPGDAWYNRFRSKAWRMTPIGGKLLRALNSGVGQQP